MPYASGPKQKDDTLLENSAEHLQLFTSEYIE